MADPRTRWGRTLASFKNGCKNKGAHRGRNPMVRERLVFPSRPYSLVRSRGAVGTTLFAMIFLCAAGIISTVPGIEQSAHAISTGLPTCATPDLREVVSTSQQSYAPLMMVVMKSSVRNSSSEICGVGVGPSSPSLIVTNSKGVVVWNNCYSNDRPGACALYLVAQTLKPGATYAKTVAWDQRSGQPPARVPTGTYQLTAHFSGIAGNDTTRFQLTTSASPRWITVTQADSGRSYSLHVGSRLFIQLIGPAIYTWSEPVSSKVSVLERLVGSSGNIATATFVARSTGRVRVTAIDNPNCYPQCLPPSRLFVVTISVVS